MTSLPRRRFLGVATLASLAGCLGDGDDESGGTTDPDDLREANVVGVSFDGENGSYSFDVTLHHDDGGEEGYANWWQVEQLDGTQLGRRELTHPHSEQPFTRSSTIDVPEDAGCVVVRGHDQTHGYGGLAVLVDLESGATETVDQGSEKASVDASDCPCTAYQSPRQESDSLLGTACELM